jgi:geranylgeranyl pyrophosphate synthase
MLQAGESNSSPEMSRLLQEALGKDKPGTAYRRGLLALLRQWSEPDTDAPSISVLPRLTCEASGGDSHQAEPVVVAWQSVRLAVKLLDDVEDGDVSDQPAQAINFATGLLFVGHLALGELAVQGMSSEHPQCLSQALHRAVLRACAGQHADLAAAQTGIADMDPDDWLETARAKSGEFLAWAAWAGALVAGADQRILACYREYGSHLGVLLQVADDFNGVWGAGDPSDLATAGLTLPVCYALSAVQGMERTRLSGLLERAGRGDEVAEAQAREWLIDLGAQGYLLAVAQVQRRQALSALWRANPVSPAGEQLAALMDRVLPALGYGVD